MPSIDDVLQLTANGLVNGSTYGLLGAGFALIYSVTERFHMAYGLTYAIAAYAAARATADLGATLWVAVAIGALASCVAGVAIEALMYRPMAKRAGRSALLTVFVGSLGLTIVGENVIRLLWLQDVNQQIYGIAIEPVRIGSVHVTRLDIQEVVSSWVLVIALTLLLARTGIGRHVRAVRVNPLMSLTVGISPTRIFLLVFAIGSAMAGVAGVFDAAQTSATPEMGFLPTLLAFVIAFMAGPARSPLFVALVGVMLGLIESLSGLWLSAQWATPVVFGVVVVYSALRPLQLRAQTRRPTGVTA